MTKTVHLKANRLCNEADMCAYMHELFPVPAHAGRNLQSIEECLKGVKKDTILLMDPACVHDICADQYAYKVLMMLGRCSEENPHIQIKFDEEA